MSKQDFIDKLTDPTEFGFRTAITEFEKVHGHMITDVIYWRKDPKLLHAGDFSEWHLELIGKSMGAVITLREVLATYILEQFPNAKINMGTSTSYDDESGLHTRTYAIAI